MHLDAARVQQVAKYITEQSHLETVRNNVAQVAGAEGFGGFSSRALSLIVVSFLVCIVGIANAMLMSVTERFREIATMKCLGATDGFIMINFILESIMQGIAGGAIGVALGFVLGELRAWGSYGWMALTSLPVLAILAAAGVAVAVSVTISALAAVYPAWVAARLAPMEAMRIE
jgi:ABC-type antimicrobial peptide transport system permease subunit